MGRILGVDYGRRRLGFAVSDPGQIIATPLSVATCGNIGEALSAVTRIAGEQQAERVVIGLPINMNGTAGELAREVEAFSRDVAQRVRIPVELWDERLTSVSAERVLIEAGTRRARRKEVIDKLAAQIMLQHYLDAKAEEMGNG